MRQHIAFVSIILFFVFLGMAGGANAERYERTGSSSMKHKSLSNAMVAAHFQCNRKGLWANIDTLEVVDTSTSQYTIAGGRKKINEYYTTVRFECTPNYKKGIEE